VHAVFTVLVEAAVLVYSGAAQSLCGTPLGKEKLLASMDHGMMGHADGMDLTRRSQLRTPNAGFVQMAFVANWISVVWGGVPRSIATGQ